MVYKAIYSLIFAFAFTPALASAGYIELQWSFVSTATGSSTISIQNDLLVEQSLEGSSVLTSALSAGTVKDFDIVSTDDDFRCNSPSGSLSSAQAVSDFYNLNDNSHVNTPSIYADCSDSGYYYVTFSTRNSTELPTGSHLLNCTLKDCFYVRYYYDSVNNQFYKNALYQNIGETTTTYTENTRFTGLSITGTSTVKVDVGHFLDSSEVDTSVPALNPQLVRFSTSLQPAIVFDSVSQSIVPFTLDAVSTTTNEYTGLADGTYDLNITFYNSASTFTGIVPFASNYIYSNFTIASGTLSAVGLVEIYSAIAVDTPRYLDCNLSNITNCFINALVYVFLPSDDTLNRFLSLRENLAEVIPFGYFIYIYDTLNTIEVDGTTALIPDLPFQDAIFTPLRTGTAFILWIMFAFLLYRRFKTIEY